MSQQDRMRVVTQDTFGGPEVLHVAQAPLPDPLPTEIRVRVLAAGVNPVDWKTRAGAGMAPVLGSPPFVLGWDVAGVVDAVGAGVNRFAPGDRVLGMPWFPRQAGCYGEFVTAPSRQFAPLPLGLDVVPAGALPLAGLTAWQALEVLDPRPGDRLLVTAGAGGVGHLLVQLAAARGCEVIATATPGKHPLLERLGASCAVDYRERELCEVVGELDAVVDLVGGDAAGDALPCLREGGRLLSVPSAVPEDLPARARAAGVDLLRMLVEPDGYALADLARHAADGRLEVLVAEVFPLEKAGLAHEVGEQRRTTGKLVLQP